MTQELGTKIGVDQCSFVRESNDTFTFPCGLEVNRVLAVGLPDDLWHGVKNAHQMHHWVCEDIFGAGYHGSYWTFFSTIEQSQSGNIYERITCPE